MKNSGIPYFLGYVEQAADGQDPLTPPISISKNGTLAKWRDKLGFVDLRINDPGLKHPKPFEAQLSKLEVLGIKAVVTLPEYVPMHFELLPVHESEHMSPKAKLTAAKKPQKLTYFKPAYLAIPSAAQNSSSYGLLTPKQCLPIIDLAAKYKVKDVIVPVSEPGVYLDAQSEIKFKKAFAELADAAARHSITLHLRNGGISETVFLKFAKEFNCKMAYDIGIGLLESDDFFNVRNKLGTHISIYFLQQVIRGLDKLSDRRENIKKSLKQYVEARREYIKATSEQEDAYAANCLKLANDALRAYYNSCRSTSCNIALYQSGDLNVITILKELKSSFVSGEAKALILSAVPNTKNNDFVSKYITPDSFSAFI